MLSKDDPLDQEATRIDVGKVAAPRIYLVRMMVFLIIAGFVVLILSPQIMSAFLSNPGLNGLIIGVLFIGALMAFRQVVRLFREVNWVNNFRLADPGIAFDKPPVLLAPMASMLRDRIGRMAITPQVMRSLLDSLAMRLDESHDISRYMTGLLVFLGLLGTFWGLLQTVSAVGATIQQLNVGTSDVGVIFEDLKSGLAAPLGGMGTAFSSSLFGLAGSLVLGFLDLQASQAQNRFYTDVEDWLSSVTDVSGGEEAPVRRAAAAAPAAPAVGVEVQQSIDRLARIISEAGPATGGASRAQTQAFADLAEGIQGLVQHIRNEQGALRELVANQARQQDDLSKLIDKLDTGSSSGGKRGGK
ncbi:MAG: flagellar motor protein MotA [Rhodobiaceae bacterium]|nr:flagellar motor protein MotA [Rhodobiaceae bacterium]MCC0048281.1 flagellar motor protein MotA [Rhodobiaceae bacterium]